VQSSVTGSKEVLDDLERERRNLQRLGF